MILLLVGIGFFVRKITDPYVQIKSENMVMVYVLPDKSVITLNKNAILKFKKKFSRDRQVRLNGEAFFQVTKDKKHPFFIHAGLANIQVVGTSFNVDNTDSATTVSVNTGKVLFSANKQHIYLTPGQTGVISNSKNIIRKINTQNNLFDYYVSHRIDCKNTSLIELAPVLEKAFGVHIIFQHGEIQNERITSTFYDNDLQQILTVLEQTLDLQISPIGKDIYIKRKSTGK